MTALATSHTAEPANLQRHSVQISRHTHLSDTTPWKLHLKRAVEAFGLAMMMSEPLAYACYLMYEADDS